MSTPSRYGCWLLFITATFLVVELDSVSMADVNDGVGAILGNYSQDGRQETDRDNPIFKKVHLWRGGEEEINDESPEFLIRKRRGPLDTRDDELNEERLDKAPKFMNVQNSIQILSYSRSKRDGPVDGWYLMSNHNALTLGVDPKLHKDTVGQWQMYGGHPELRCIIFRFWGNGYRVQVGCTKPGTYFAFYKVLKTFTDKAEIEHCTPLPGEHTCKDDCQYCYRQEDELTVVDTLEGDSTSNQWEVFQFQNYKNHLKDSSYSDPIKVIDDYFCYRWAFRLILQNEVGFVFDDAAATTDGTYRVYELKVWVVDNFFVAIEELEGGLDRMEPNSYSQTITMRFNELGVTPCIRKAHTSIEVTAAAVFRDTDANDKDIGGSEKLIGPYWRFQLKVYLDRVVTTLSDVALTITPRQHSALYGCFIADVRVVIPTRKFTFLKTAREELNHIYMAYSKLADVRKRFVMENAISFFGEATRYQGPWWNRGHDIADKRTDVVVFPNPCVSLEFAVAYKGILVMTEDGLMDEELKKITLPSFFEDALALQKKILNLSPAQEAAQKDKLNSDSGVAINGPILQHIVDLVFTPVNIILLTKHASLYLHPSNLGLKGIGFTTTTQKYRLGSLVRRKWCASTATPKSHNMWVPAFSRTGGNIVVVYSIPVEGTLIINRPADLQGCVPTFDSTAERGKSFRLEAANETEIHKDESADTEIDAVSNRKLRSKTALRREAAKANRKGPEAPKVNLDELSVYWITGERLLDRQDKHFAKGATDPANVKIGTNNTEFNKHVLFVIDRDFQRIRTCLEDNGLTFDMDETVYKDPERIGTSGETIERDATNEKMFQIHALEFSAVEKRYMVSIEFQSQEFKKETTTEKMHSMVVIVLTYSCLDLPVVVTDTTADEVDLDSITVSFSGSILKRNDVEKEFKKRAARLGFPAEHEYVSKTSDYTYKYKAVKPAPLSKYTASMNTMNTANPIYVIRLNDVLIYASLDGSFAKPLLFYEINPTVVDFTIHSAFMPFHFFDVIVTEAGIISALSRKTDDSDVDDKRLKSRNEAFIGSVLSDEPLRYVHPFLPSDIPYQIVLPEGEIQYGILHPNFNAKDDDIRTEGTTTLDVPFWSLFKGSVAYTAGENKVQLDVKKHEVNIEAEANIDPICPFSHFDVEYIAYPYVECQYKTRLTAEISFYGDLIPLEADLVVEFSEVQGISVQITSFLEVDFDQTIIRKAIDLESSMTKPFLHDIYKRHLTEEDDDPIKEKIRVFSLTVKSSILNLHCEKREYFKTIQMNIGCVPFTKMKLIGEALPLKRKHIYPWDESQAKDDETKWFQDNEANVLSAPRELINAGQRALFGCKEDNSERCKIPIPHNAVGTTKEANASMFDVFELSFRDVLVPKFEQFLTKHARRVSGNVIIYDLLDSAFPEYNARPRVNLTQWHAKCAVNDTDWYSKLIMQASERNERPNERPKSKTPLSYHTDIYRHFIDCFRTKPPVTEPDQDRVLQHLEPQQLQAKPYSIFNRTNLNALKLARKRNYFYVFRAVVVNIDHNRFTYCDRLETFFGLQVSRIPKQRSPLEWFVYVLIVICVLLFVIFSYVYFAKTYTWRTVLLTNTKAISDEPVYGYDDALQQQLLADEINRQDQFAQVVKNVHVVTRWKKMLKRHQATQVHTQGPTPKRGSKMANSARPSKVAKQ